jgi:serine/threonine protein kinase
MMQGMHSVFEVAFDFSEDLSGILDYDLKKPIYSNDSCSIFMARLKKDHKQFFAIKKSRIKNRILMEYQNYSKIQQHDNIIRCYQTWEINRNYYIQLELAEFGSIRSNVSNFEDRDVWRIFAHVANALAHIHKSGFMHLDISPSNILCCANESIGTMYKLADFGTSLPIGEFTADSEGAGPYVSPEALAFPNTEYEVGAATDIFSLGIVMLELVTHKVAPRVFPGYNNIRNGTYDLSGIPEEFSFIKAMLSPNPDERPTAVQLLQLDNCQREINLLHPIVHIF